MLRTGELRIQKTENQAIAELWCSDRKLSIYIDATGTEIYQVQDDQPVGDPITDFAEALKWLADTKEKAK